MLPSGKAVPVGPWSQEGREMLAFGEESGMEYVIAMCPLVGFAV